jgi:hypothetical protein
MSSPTQRTLAALRKAGWTAQVVERWNAYAKIRVDLYGCVDILAIKPECGNWAVQACITGDMRKRLKKSLAEPRLKIWLQASEDNRFSVIGWAKRGARGMRKTFQMKEFAVLWDREGQAFRLEEMEYDRE